MCFEKHYSEQTSRSLKTKEYIFKNTQSYAHSYVHTHTHTFYRFQFAWFIFLSYSRYLRKGGGVQKEALTLGKDLREGLGGLPLIQDCIKWKKDPLAYLSNIGLF